MGANTDNSDLDSPGKAAGKPTLAAEPSVSPVRSNGLAWFTLATSTCGLLLVCVWALFNQDKLLNLPGNQVAALTQNELVQSEGTRNDATDVSATPTGQNQLVEKQEVFVLQGKGAASKTTDQVEPAAAKVEQERLAEQQQAEKEALAAQQAEEARLAAEKAEQEKLAAQQAEAERLAAEKAEQEKLAAQQAEEARLAAEKAEQEKLAAQQAEEERLAAEKAEQEQLAAQQAEAERQAAQKAEQEKLAAQRAEEERLAAEKAEQEKLAAQQAEEARLAAEKAEQEKLAAQQAEEERLAAEKAEQEKLAAQQAEEARLAAEKVEQEKLAAQQAEEERLAFEKAEQEAAAALAATQAEQARLAAANAETDALAAELQAAANDQDPESATAEGLEDQQLAALAVQPGAAPSAAETAFERVRREELASIPGLSARVRFENNDVVLRESALPPMDRLFELLFLYSESSVTVQVASNEFDLDNNNKLISRERALTLVNYLIDRGLDEGRFRIRALGKQRLPFDSHRVTVFATVIDK